MSLMRINYIHKEIKKLKPVIQNLITNYNNDFQKYDSEYIKFEKEELIQESKNNNMSYDIQQEKNKYLDSLDDLKSLAQFQNELMLVKHMALLENCIINTFKCLIDLSQHQEYKKTYFIEIENFSDSFIASNKIKELTDGKIDLKKIKFWDLYETMKTIRNSIAHGEPLFIISYNRVKRFNKEINIIFPYSEKNEDKPRNGFPSLIHPTYEKNSKWFCHLSDDISNLSELNKKCLEFIEEIKNLYLSYGKHKKISKHELYGCTSYNKNEETNS